MSIAASRPTTKLGIILRGMSEAQRKDRKNGITIPTLLRYQVPGIDCAKEHDQCDCSWMAGCEGRKSVAW
jgi:hypothetical protein